MQNEANQIENMIVPDKRRLSKLSVGIAAFYAFCGLLFFFVVISLIVCLSPQNYVDQNGKFRPLVDGIFDLFIIKGGIWAVLLALLLFAAILMLGNLTIIKRVLSGKKTQYLSYFFSFFSIWISIVVAWAGIILALKGWGSIFPLNHSRITALIVFAIIASISAVLLGRLLDLSIRGLMWAPGFGIPKE